MIRGMLSAYSKRKQNLMVIYGSLYPLYDLFICLKSAIFLPFKGNEF